MGVRAVFGTVKLAVVHPILGQSSVQAQDTTGEHATLQSQRVQAVEGGAAGPAPHPSTLETVAIQKSLLCKEPEGVKFVSWIQKLKVSHAEALLCHGIFCSTLSSIYCSAPSSTRPLSSCRAGWSPGDVLLISRQLRNQT